MPAIECEDLVKVFGGRKPVRALDKLTLSVEEGEVFGLLGPNGSGKTTFVKCCLNIIFPTSGKLRVLGRHPGHPLTARETGYLPESPSFYEHLSGVGFLLYHAELARIPSRERRRRVEEVLEMVKLDELSSRRRLRTYSKGMLQRIGLAQALIAKPRIVFLDEPQTGLDPIGRAQVKSTMREAARQGTTVLFSSHVLADVEDVADRVAIVDRGKVRRIARLEELTLRTNHVLVRLRPPRSSTISDSGAVPESVRRAVDDVGAGAVTYVDGLLSCTVSDEELIPRLVYELCKWGNEIFEVTRERMTLEQTFLKEFSAG